MDHKISYLNSDLDLASADDLSELAASLSKMQLDPFCEPVKGDDGLWHVTFETYGMQKDEPEQSIDEMLLAVESLSKPLQNIWSNCTLREFNIGYDCGNEPWAFNQGLSAKLLQRIAAVGASIRITIYPDREQQGH